MWYAGDPVTAAVIGTAIWATGGSLYASSQAAKQQKRSLQFQQEQQKLALARERREQVRQARKARAAIQAAAAGAGVTSSSGLEGGVSSVGSQLSSNLNYLTKQETLSDQASMALGKATDWGNKANIFAGVASLATLGLNYAPTGKTPTPQPTSAASFSRAWIAKQPNITGGP